MNTNVKEDGRMVSHAGKTRTKFHRYAAWASILLSPWLMSFAIGACSSTSTVKSPADESREEFVGTTRDNVIKHEPCDSAGKKVVAYEAASPVSSAKSHVTHIFDGDKEVCSFTDLNGDGNVDLYTYFDAQGRMRRQESAYDTDAKINEIVVYKDGVVDTIYRETDFDGKIDTWDYHTRGILTSRERDKNGDGRIDEFWTFDMTTGQATIIQADRRTGKPDPSQSIKIETTPLTNASAKAKASASSATSSASSASSTSSTSTTSTTSSTSETSSSAK